MPDPSANQPDPAIRIRGPGLITFGGYEIEGELGRGGMGVVYLARQIRLNRRVALKMLTGHYGPDELQRFRAEAETAAGLHHTNIAHIYEVGENDGAPFFSMEHVEGGSLADRLRQKMPTPREAAQLLIPIARALHFAHQNGVVHRDMKPGNVLLDSDGIPKVTDFGIAKRLADETHLTLSGAIVGTPTYMSPEQARGSSRDVGPPADIYSLGAIFYEMLAGRPPFLPEESMTAVTVRVLTEDPVSPAWHRPEIPRDLEVICMKCLEKEPRDRYASAAAFAEDLRRFLDDESIIARPPTTMVRTVKWVRRHPWKFVSSAVFLILVIAGIARFTQWELYERIHLEYSVQVDWTNGGLEPLVKISHQQAGHRAAYLQLTRRGRWGSITKLEVLNSRGNPAVLRRVNTSEMIPIYIEGLAGALPDEKKTPESTVIDILYNGKTAVEATSRDRNGGVLWRILYDQTTTTDTQAHLARARFVNLHGFDSGSQNGASHMEFIRDAQGHDLKITFFNTNGKPALNGEEVYGYQLTRDSLGRLVKLVNLDSAGHPMANSVGLIAFKLQWGREIHSEVIDAEGKPATLNGVSTVVKQFDDAGNPVRVSNLAPDGKPEASSATEWSVMEMKRNEHGELIHRQFLKADSSGVLKIISECDFQYDDFGHPADIRFKGKVFWRSALRHDINGNLLEEKYLDAQGQPVLGDKGFAITKFNYTTGPQGYREEKTYFDASGNKAYWAGSYHRVINEFDATGVFYRQIQDEHDQTKFSFYRYVNEPEYDTQGRLRHSITRFEDKNGRLVSGDTLLFNVLEDFYDDQGRLSTEWKSGCSVKDFGGPILRIDTEWHTTGTPKSRTRSVCDANRKPLPVISTGTAARFEEVYDSIGQPERLSETGFDERIVGYSSRETVFGGGKLQTVTHKRGDGSVVSKIKVFITGVIPSAEQPKASELKAGDQFVSANGIPITNGYAWVYSGTFPGGWVEVIRNGQRIRIGGLEAGSLGVILEDHAADLAP